MTGCDIDDEVTPHARPAPAAGKWKELVGISNKGEATQGSWVVGKFALPPIVLVRPNRDPPRRGCVCVR